MKIALSSKGNDLDNNMDLRFGRAEYFIIYNIENDEFQAIENKGHTASGGAGIASAQQLIEKSIDVVISGNFGPNAYDLLKDSEIKMYKGEDIPIKELIQNYKLGKLEEIKSAGPSHKGGH
ncbi:MAG: diguanylate cyclase [Tissierellia bacterium]|nr:diguanylate cyclase [Tissierellia bacterium]